jgi:hypothetical protein
MTGGEVNQADAVAKIYRPAPAGGQNRQITFFPSELAIRLAPR